MEKIICLCSACGIGKSTLIDYLKNSELSKEYFVVDTDELDLNWWDYAKKENPDEYTTDCIKKSIELSKDKPIIFGSCLNPTKIGNEILIPENIKEIYLVALICSTEEVIKRLKARDPKRMCGDDSFINEQIKYNNWIKDNINLYDFYIDNTNDTIDVTAQKFIDYINIKLTK